MDDSPRMIFVVEDDRDHLELMRHAMRRSDVRGSIRVARDGEEALELLHGGDPGAGDALAERPALILLDLHLPRVSGLDVLRNIKSNPATRTIPVVVLTTSREPGDVLESYRLGANSYIVKPLDFHEFSNAIDRILVYWLTLNEDSPR